MCVCVCVCVCVCIYKTNTEPGNHSKLSDTSSTTNPVKHTQLQKIRLTTQKTGKTRKPGRVDIKHSNYNTSFRNMVKQLRKTRRFRNYPYGCVILIYLN